MEASSVEAAIGIDFGRVAVEYVRHRPEVPALVLEALHQAGIGAVSARIVDLGTGTGNLARALARDGCRVTGVDPSAALLAEARARDEAELPAGARPGYVLARAEATGLSTGAFDAVVASQAWHWFRRAEAAREARRLLAPGGRIGIAHFDWLLGEGGVADATEALLDALGAPRPAALALGGGVGVYRDWLGDLRRAGFEDVRSSTRDAAIAFSKEGWFGRVRASGRFSALAPEAARRFERELAARLGRSFPGEAWIVAHRAFVASATRPAEEKGRRS